MSKCVHCNDDGYCMNSGALVATMCDSNKCRNFTPELDTTEHKCAYCDAEGFCRNESHQGGGYKCCGCEDYTKAAAPIAVEAAVVPVPAPATQSQSQLEREAAYRLSRQYHKATLAFGSALEQVVCFGSMLTEWESYIWGWGKKGEGIKSWLAANCPEINYATAMGYKHLGQKAAALIGGGAQALAVLTGRETVKAPGATDETPVDAEVVAKKNELFREATSRRKLEQLYFRFMGEATPRQRGEVKQIPKMKRTDEAKAIWNGVMQIVSKTSVRDAIPLLDESATKACYDGLKDILKALKNHISEFEADE